MQQTFYKYQGTGNDFVMIDNRQETFNKKDTKQIAFLCDRRFGIGADGLILLENHPTSDFKMVYYNADGNDKTAFFYTEGKFICAGESYTFGVPAVENYQAVEDSVVMLFHKDTTNELLKNDIINKETPINYFFSKRCNNISSKKGQ